MVHKCWLSRHSPPINTFIKFLLQKSEIYRLTFINSRNRSLITRATAWAPHTESKRKTRVGWTNNRTFFFFIKTYTVNTALIIETDDCFVWTLFLLYFWLANHLLPLNHNLHCFVFGIIFNISKSRWTKGSLLWLLVDNISSMICLLCSVSMPTQVPVWYFV